MKFIQFMLGAGTLFISALTSAVPLKEVQALVDETNGINNVGFTQYSASSADLKHVYAISSTDWAINAFQREPDGTLTLIESYQGIEATGEGARSPQDILISPDGKHLYVTALKPDDVTPTLYVYDRDASTGLLSEVQAYRDRGLNSPAHLTISEDGRYLYVSSLNSRSLTVLARSSNGTVTEKQFLTDLSQNLSSNTNYPSYTLLSPDQNDFYIGMYNGSSNNGVIAHFARDNATGLVTYTDQIDYTQSGLTDLGHIRGLSISPDGTHVYATDTDAIYEFARTGNGTLNFLRTTPIDSPDSKYSQYWYLNNIVLSNNGQMAYATDTVADAIIVFHRDETTGALTYRGAEVHGVDDVTELRQNERVTLSPDGLFAYVGSAYALTTFAIYTDISLQHSAATTEGEATISFTISSNGPASAHDLEFIITLPDGVDITAASAFSNDTECELDAHQIICTRDTLDPIQEEEVTVTIATNDVVDIDYNSVITIAEIDIDETNNTAGGSINMDDDSGNGSGGNNNTGSDSSGSSGGGYTSPIAILCLVLLALFRRKIVVHN